MNDLSLRDAPLTFHSSLEKGHVERKRDTLNLLPYAEALRDFIHECETPMTIGIQGDWGIGKTSLMNMLRGTEESDESGLLEDDRCQIVNFETWPYSQFNRENTLVLACMQALTAKVAQALSEKEAVNVQDVESAAGAARAKLENVLNHIRANLATGRQVLDGAASPPPMEDISAQMISFRKEFEELVRLWVGDDGRRRIVIFIDDLDRVHPSEALLLLEAIKNFVDVPGCVFVLAVDYQVVQKGMMEKLGRDAQRTIGKAFYDKIIQLPFVMPTASYQLEDYIAGLLVKTGFPLAGELAHDEDSREYFLNITLCTVGRNPRNIKRVMNYANLLERIRKRQGGGESGSRDARILYALICMQIAWPELFDHFVNDPTVDTVTSLQNWEFLDRLPEAKHLFDREADVEKVKNNIATFFDTLFSVLDENDDGQIDSRELAPVLDVMALACMTAVESRERPRDYFIRRVRENNTEDDPLVETFLENVFMRSVWYLGSECRYRRSGTRYVTIVHHGRQIGSLVTLKNQPFVFRLAMAPEKVKSGLKAYWHSNHSVKTEAITFTRSVFGKEASLTGFGDTLVDFSKMTNMPSKDAVGLLNALFRIVTLDTLPEWEMDPGRSRY